MPYLIDGNNLLGSWGGPAVRSPGGDGRLEVVRRVAEFARARSARVVLVFDGAPFRPDGESQWLGRVSLRFPPPAADADSVIRGIVDGSRRPADWTVVTSDKALYSYVRSRGARVLRAHEWNTAARRASKSAEDPAAEKPEREDDVEGWLRRFGVDE